MTPNNPTPAVEALLDEYVRLYVEALDATDGRGTQEANEARWAILARFAELERERDEARKDADRYQHTRAHCIVGIGMNDYSEPWDIDTAIDAAIAQRAGETG